MTLLRRFIRRCACAHLRAFTFSFDMSNVQLTLADRFFKSVQTLEGFHLQQTAGHTIIRDSIEIHHTERGDVEGGRGKRGGGERKKMIKKRLIEELKA